MGLWVGYVQQRWAHSCPPICRATLAVRAWQEYSSAVRRWSLNRMPTPPSDKVGLSPTPSASEIDAILLDLYRICCASLPERQQAVLSPAATIGSPMLECVQAVAQADQGALVLAHLSGSMGVWLAPGELERG